MKAMLSTHYMTAAADGKSYSVVFYSLEMIIAVGFRTKASAVRSSVSGPRAI